MCVDVCSSMPGYMCMCSCLCVVVYMSVCRFCYMHVCVARWVIACDFMCGVVYVWLYM